VNNTGASPGIEIRTTAGVGGFGNIVNDFTCFSGSSCVQLMTGTGLNVVTDAVSLIPQYGTGAGAFGAAFNDVGTNNYFRGVVGKGAIMQPGGFIMNGAGDQVLFEVVDVASAVNYLVAHPTIAGTTPGFSGNNTGGAATGLSLGGTAGGYTSVLLPLPCSGAPSGALCTGTGTSTAAIK
jgi:hypothetical protein